MSSITWTAIYKDGSFLSQCEEDGTSHSSQEIDRTKLKTLVLSINGNPLIHQHFEPGQRLIFRRRVDMNMTASTGEVQGMKHVYLLGWQKTINGENIQHVCYVFEEEGRIEMAGKFSEDNDLLSKPIPIPEDDVQVE